MLLRLALLALLAVVLTGCDAVRSGPDGPTGPCDGVRLDEVRGQRPAYADRPLARFTNDSAACAAVWVPLADGRFVPQGVALDGDTAWVSGYRWRPGYGNRPCRVVHVDLRTGRLLATQPRLDGAVPGGPPVFCHHGGGIALNEHGLWVAETGRLWLLAPDRVGRPDAVRRVWRLDGPVSGGILVTGQQGRFGLGDFREDRDARMYWFRYADLLAPDVVSLDVRSHGSPRRAVAVRRSTVPRYAQGGAADPDGPRAPYLTSSVSRCGMLVTPDDERLAFGPGAEGIAFDGKGGLWAVLESGSRSYHEQGRPLVPSLVRFDLDQLRAGESERCPW